MKTYIESRSTSLEGDNKWSWEKNACKSATRSAALPDP